MYLLDDNRKKLIKYCLKRGRRREGSYGSKIEGINSFKVQCMHLWKSHNKLL
jgi:hypothetical protein